MNKGFFNFCSFKSKTKGLYENHNSLFLITCITIITILLGGLFVHTSLMPKTYKSKDFVSSVVQTPEKKISNRADVNGIFTYGPYINLNKGQYNITLDYSSTNDQKFEITYGNGWSLHLRSMCCRQVKTQKHSSLMCRKTFLTNQ